MRAFGEIDIDPGLVQELVGLKQAEQLGYRILIQNGLYSHIQSVTGAPFYSPFFIKSPDAHRSYWFIHLSKHREARNVAWGTPFAIVCAGSEGRWSALRGAAKKEIDLKACVHIAVAIGLGGRSVRR